MLTFALDGDGVLPAYELPPGRERPLAHGADAAAIERGSHAYARFCARCHGAGAVSDGSVPDLRKLDNTWYEQFDQVVLEGRMQGMGMPRFDSVLDAAGSADVRAYLLDLAEEQWQLEQDPDWWLAFKTWLADKVATTKAMAAI